MEPASESSHHESDGHPIAGDEGLRVRFDPVDDLFLTAGHCVSDPSDPAGDPVDSIRIWFTEGAEIITTGLSAEIAQTLVAIGADISKLNTAGDLQGGLEQAEHQLGITLVSTDRATG